MFCSGLEWWRQTKKAISNEVNGFLLQEGLGVSQFYLSQLDPILVFPPLVTQKPQNSLFYATPLKFPQEIVLGRCGK